MSAEVTDTPAEAAEGRPMLDRIADWTIRPTSFALQMGWVAGALVVATLLRMILDPYLPAGFPFLTYFPAVALTAVLAGTRPGLVLATLCYLGSWYLFIPPYRSLVLDGPSAIALALYGVVVGTELSLVYIMRRALKRLAAAEAAAREQARSRTLMFQELQHRVSNNLAVVGSLLHLQRRSVKDADAAHALEASAARVNVVSRLNRLLHDPQAQQIDFGAFLRAVVPDAVAAAGTGDRVKVSVTAEPVVLPADKAVPLGLVATELLSNALEHGFPKGGRGNVRVSLEAGEGRAQLAIRDDGAGLPQDFDLDRSRSLGLQIARQFAGQLGATLSITDEGGVVSRLEVPLD